MVKKISLANLEAEPVAALVAATSDVALILDEKGIIQDVAFGNDELAQEWEGKWVGRHWLDTVTVESRPKIDSLLREAASPGRHRWRQVNHAAAQGADIPVQYVAVQVDAGGRVVAVGRELRSIAVLQQRLVSAQQSIERDYSRLRQMEMRYRLLFQATPEAILIVDASTLLVSEANPAATSLLADPGRPIVGRPLAEAFEAAGAEAIQNLLAGVRATGRGEEIRASAALGGQDLRVAASMFRQEGTSVFLVRIAPTSEPTAGTKARPGSLDAMERLPDGIVVTDLEGAVLDANAAFLDILQVATVEQVRGESLDRWLGRPGVDLNVLLANLRQHGMVRLYATTLQGEFATPVEVELSAAVAEGAQPCVVFSARDTGRRLGSEPKRQELPHSVEQLKDLVGRVPLKDLVRETTDVVEQLCIQAALELTGDNRASAAEILGLSRQSLYVKLRRYGMSDAESDEG